MKMKLLAAFIPLIMATIPVQAEEVYPTQETVRNIIDCMSELGAQNEQNLYTCTCRFDYLKQHMSYEEYDSAMVFDRNFKMPGERGGFVRDNVQGQKASKNYEKILAESEKQCPVVRHIEAKIKDNPDTEVEY